MQFLEKSTSTESLVDDHLNKHLEETEVSAWISWWTVTLDCLYVWLAMRAICLWYTSSYLLLLCTWDVCSCWSHHRTLFFTKGCLLVSLLYQQLSVLIQQHPYFFSSIDCILSGGGCAWCWTTNIQNINVDSQLSSICLPLFQILWSLQGLWSPESPRLESTVYP